MSKTVLITGASSGIGHALAKYYGSKGYKLILIARRKDRLNALKEALEVFGVHVDVYANDLSDFEATHKLSTEMLCSYKHIDLVILNAGISIGHSTHTSNIEDFKKLYDTNLLSVHVILEPLLHKFKKSGDTKIVFISSLASLISMPSSIAYSSSKRALNAYAEGLRYQLLPYNVNVLNILPGFIDTELTQKNRFKMPFFMDINRGTSHIVNAIEKNRRFYAFPFIFYTLIRLLNIMPQFIKDKIVMKYNFSSSKM
ncbi:MAG: SDR family NAD(P)-dependent oxidoreductase [Campylobacterota bacterium]|nr:SDR family NAD(P)-dependent oxidoreductase [Campylobacterota bacterium]